MTAPPKRILYCITKANWGGAQRYVFDLAVAAKEKGHEVTVAFGEKGSLQTRLESKGVRTLHIEEMQNKATLSTFFASQKSLYSLLKKEQPDVVHFNSSVAGLVGTFAARRAHISRIIFTAHGWAFNEARPLPARVLFACLQYLTVALSHTTIAVSQAVVRDASWMLFVQKKFKLVRLGIACPLFITKENARTSLLPAQEHSFWIGMIAELHPTKRIRDSIDALFALHSAIPDAILIVMGEGHERPQLEKQIAALGLKEKVFLLGHTPDAATYLKALDIFIMPSWTEASGYALIEAGYAGLPTVASRVGGMIEVIDDQQNGILVERGNPKALSKVLSELYSDTRLSQKYGQALKVKVEESFSLQTMIEKTEKIYRS